jgi:capsular polysaccharide biosynthesis protein
MIDSSAAAAATSNALGPGWTPGRVASAITVTPLGGTNVLAVQAVAGQAKLATRIADTFVVAALTQRKASLITAATALVADLKAASHPLPATQLDRLLAVSHGFDPTFSVLHLAGRSASAPRAAAWRVLSLVLFVGLVLGVGVALLIDLVIRRRTGADVVELTIKSVPSRKDAPRP